MQTNQSQKIRDTLNSVVMRFKSGDIPEAIAISIFPIPNILASKWSLLNRIIMALAGTSDARGFHQWKSGERKVKKGAKAIRILATVLKRAKKEAEASDEEEIKLAGFMPVPVFKVENTTDKSLDYEEIKLPKLPLMDIAQK